MNKPMEKPKQDLMNEALRHYEEASEALHCWRSDIPKAIKQYYSEPSADKLRKEDAKSGIKIEPLEFLHDSELQRMYLYRKINEIIDYLNAVIPYFDKEQQ